MTTVRTLTLGALLKRLRQAAGMTQEELAAKAGLSPHGISDLERGARRLPRKDTIALIADALNLGERDRTLLEAAARQRLAAAGAASSAAAAMGARPAAPGGATVRLVGRAAELAALERHLRGEGPPLLLIAGEPGIGKSRLLHEAIQRAPGEGLTALAGGCHRRSGQEPYAPLLAALERHLAPQSPAERRASLQGCGWLVRLLPELAETLAPFTHAGALPPEQERRLTFAAVARYLRNVAGPGGTLLALDDLQWAGPDALDLLAYLVRGADDQRMRLLVAYRDTEVRTQTPLAELLADLAREGLAERRTLVPLAAPEAEALLGELLAGAPQDGAALHKRILDRTGGVPFFLVSCAQGVSAGALSHASFEGDVGGATGEEIPWSVAETIRQRVAALPEPAQELLAVASVVGRTAPRAVLAAATRASGYKADGMVAALEAASQARLLVEDGPDAYTFAHDLVREVVAAGVSAARRAVLHREVAAALEALPGAPPAGLLAYHLLRAGDVERAVGYLERAADDAQARYANGEAEVHYRELIARLDELGRPADAARIRWKLGKLLAGLARYADAIALQEQARAAFEAAGDRDGAAHAAAHAAFAWAMANQPDRSFGILAPFLEPAVVAGLSASAAADLYAALGTVTGYSGRYEEQVAAAERAAHFAREAGDERILAMALLARAFGAFFLGHLDESAEVIAAAMPAIERSGNLFVLSQALSLLGGGFEVRGELATARGYLERSFAVAEQSGDPAMLAFAHNQLGALAMFTGEWDEMRGRHEAAADLLRGLGPTWATTYARFYLGLSRFDEGRSDEATALIQEAIALAERGSDLMALRWAQLAQGMVDVHEGRPQAVIDRLAPLLAGSGAPSGDLTMLLPTLAAAHLLQGEVERADEVAAQAVAMCRAASNRIWLIEALTVQGSVRAAQGRVEEAQAAFDEALQIACAIPYRSGEGHVLFAVGTARLLAGDAPTARDLLAQALAIFEELGEVPFAVRTRALLAGAEGVGGAAG